MNQFVADRLSIITSEALQAELNRRAEEARQRYLQVNAEVAIARRAAANAAKQAEIERRKADDARMVLVDCPLCCKAGSTSEECELCWGENSVVAYRQNPTEASIAPAPAVSP